MQNYEHLWWKLGNAHSENVVKKFKTINTLRHIPGISISISIHCWAVGAFFSYFYLVLLKNFWGREWETKMRRKKKRAEETKKENRVHEFTSTKHASCIFDEAYLRWKHCTSRLLNLYKYWTDSARFRCGYIILYYRVWLLSLRPFHINANCEWEISKW